MKILIFSAYDPIPSDKTTYTRYARLAECLAEKNINVEYVTSSFYHTAKKQRLNKAWYENKEHAKIKVVQLKTTSYIRNVGFGRIFNHWQLNKELKKYLASLTILPDAVVIASPPLKTANTLLHWASKNKIISILDIQDLWPEAWEQFIPATLPKKFVLRRWAHIAEENQMLANAIAAVTKDYIYHIRDKPTKVIYLGTDVQEFREPQPPSTKEIKLIHVGSPQTNSPLGEIINLLGNQENISLTVVGQQIKSDYYKNIIAKKGFKNIEIIPWMPMEKLAAQLPSFTAGMAILNNASKALFPNRLFLYFAAGLPVITNISGCEVEEIIKLHNAGFVINNLTKDTLREAIEKTAAIPLEQRFKIRQLALEKMNVKKIYADYADWIVSLIKK